MNTDYDYLFKLLIVGDSGVGKSSLMLRFSDNAFSTDHIATIGVDFKIRTIELDDKIIKLQIWDTAGSEKFRSITSSYYKGAHGTLLVFDYSSIESFENITKWMDEILAYSSPHLEIVVIGNKSDLVSSVTDDMIQSKLVGDWATRFPAHPIQFVKTSAKNNINIENAFFTLATSIKSRMVHQSIVQSRSAHIQYSKKGIQTSTRKSCGCSF